jgi:frataxin
MSKKSLVSVLQGATGHSRLHQKTVGQVVSRLQWLALRRPNSTTQVAKLVSATHMTTWSSPCYSTFLNNHPVLSSSLSSVRWFQSVGQYHQVADETLDAIQDALDGFFEGLPQQSGQPDPEVSLSSGVLTIVMPPHGTWVLNKQTPNQQIWWSSPISGPRRYEYENEHWVFTRVSDGGSETLGQALRDEIQQIYHTELILEDVE